MAAIEAVAQYPAPPRRSILTPYGKGLRTPIPTADTELRLPVSLEVNVNLCLSSGSLTVNGWERGELRLFINDGLPAELHVQKKNDAGQPELVMARTVNKNLPTGFSNPECLSGKVIEIDVPKGAALKIDGRSVHISVDTVRRVNIRNLNGNISLRNVTGHTDATTYQGNIVVENAPGVINLLTTTGNIVAVEAASKKPGEMFRARTSSGAIALKNISHYQMEVNTISGALAFDGSFLKGGIYNFRTLNGPIKLNLPENSSFMLNALYGFGKFESGIPIKVIRRSDPGKTGTITASFGSGDAEVSLSTNSGTIGIGKRQ